mgnify:CR=1 FL=1
MLHLASEFTASLNLNLRVFKLARNLAGGSDVQVIAAVNNLMQFAFHFNTAGSDLASDFARLANEDFFSGKLTIDRSINGGFFGYVQSTFEGHAIAND